MRQFENMARDNTYNSENEFSSEFTWTVWMPREDKYGDWLWSRNAAYIAVCRHRGGDVRGNYGAVSLHRVDDCIGDSGFLDWVLGWYVRRFEGFYGREPGFLNPNIARWIVEEAVEDEKLTELCSPGYANLPSSQLWDVCGDQCEWFKGSAILKCEDGSGWIVATPYMYIDGSTEDIVETPEDGSGWLCDAMIDTDRWIDEVLGPCVLEQCYGYSDRIDSMIDNLEWDSDEEIAKVAGFHDAMEVADAFVETTTNRGEEDEL